MKEYGRAVGEQSDPGISAEHARIVQAQAAATMAVSEFRRNQSDRAQASLADCNKVIETKLPKLEQAGARDLGKDWREWIITHALQSEANRMIEGEPSSAAPPANPAR